MFTILSDGYPVHIGENALQKLKDYLQQNTYSQYFILVDENTLQFCISDVIQNVEILKDEMADFINRSGTLTTLQKFRGNTNFPIPKFITIHVGTSSSGSGQANAEAAQYRINYLYQFVKSALDGFGVDDAIIKQIITTNTNAKYTPTQLDKINSWFLTDERGNTNPT